jgi:uncharacterized protein (DUF2236 family)
MHASNEYVTDSGADFDFWNVTVDTSDPPAEIAREIETVENPEEGFFGPDSMVWQVNRENAAFLNGITAAALQLGHPKVNAGVYDHSDFDKDPNARFVRTFAIVDSILFGDVETAVEAAMTVRRVHDWVTGELEEDVGPYEAGEEYDANQEDNLLWVAATLIEQALRAYETYVEELTDAEKEQYYQEIKTFGVMFGVPREKYPETIDDFWDYYETELEETIGVGERGMENRNNLLDASALPGTNSLRILRPIQGFLAAGPMPEPAREAFGLTWNRRRQFLYDAFTSVVSGVLPHLPDALRYNRNYRRNVSRLQNFHHVRLEPENQTPTVQ